MKLTPKSTETVQNIISRLDKEIELEGEPSPELKKQFHKVQLTMAKLKWQLDVLNDMKKPS